MLQENETSVEAWSNRKQQNSSQLGEKEMDSKYENILHKYLLEEEDTVTDDVGVIVELGSTTTKDATKESEHFKLI